MTKELENKISLFEPDKKIDAGFSVLFSGGLDSTAVPLLLGEKFKGDIHLVTLDHNYGNLFLDWSKKHVADLKRIFGDNRVHHEIFNITPYFKKITLKNIGSDFRKHGHFIWCLGCMLSTLARVMIVNLENRIPFAFVCSSVGGEYSIMSTPASISAKREMTLKYGIDYRAPLLELNIRKPEERAILNKHDVWPGIKILKGVQGVQPVCIPGFMHIMDNLFDLHTIPNPDKVKAYIRLKEPIIDMIIQDHFSRKNLDLKKHIHDMKSHLEEL